MTPTDHNELGVVYVTEGDGILTITISTDRSGNSLAGDALTEGTAALRRIVSETTDVGAILLRGGGANFCTGGDVLAFAAAPDRPAYIRHLADSFHAFIGALIGAGIPIVAAVKAGRPARE